MRNFERLITLIALGAVMVLGFQNCSEVADTGASSGSSSSSIDPAEFQALQTEAMAILDRRCASCHDGFQQNPDMRNLVEMRAVGWISPGRPEFSPAYNSIPSGRMPPGFNMMNNAPQEVQTIYRWIQVMR